VLTSSRGMSESTRFLLERGADIEGRGPELLAGRRRRGAHRGMESEGINRRVGFESVSRFSVSSPSSISPLLAATANGHSNLSLMLLQQGADPQKTARLSCASASSESNNSGRGPPSTPSSKSSVASDGVTALHCAAAGDQPELLRALLKRGADPNARDGMGRTPLMMAAWGGAVGAARTLVEEARDGLEINAVDLSRPPMHALDYAVRAKEDGVAGAVEMEEFLLGPDVNDPDWDECRSVGPGFSSQRNETEGEEKGREGGGLRCEGETECRDAVLGTWNLFSASCVGLATQSFSDVLMGGVKDAASNWLLWAQLGLLGFLGLSGSLVLFVLPRTCVKKWKDLDPPMRPMAVFGAIAQVNNLWGDAVFIATLFLLLQGIDPPQSAPSASDEEGGGLSPTALIVLLSLTLVHLGISWAFNVSLCRKLLSSVLKKQRRWWRKAKEEKSTSIILLLSVFSLKFSGLFASNLCGLPGLSLRILRHPDDSEGEEEEAEEEGAEKVDQKEEKEGEEDRDKETEKEGERESERGVAVEKNDLDQNSEECQDLREIREMRSNGGSLAPSSSERNIEEGGAVEGDRVPGAEGVEKEKGCKGERQCSETDEVPEKGEAEGVEHASEKQSSASSKKRKYLSQEETERVLFRFVSPSSLFEDAPQLGLRTAFFLSGGPLTLSLIVSTAFAVLSLVLLALEYALSRGDNADTQRGVEGEGEGVENGASVAVEKGKSCVEKEKEKEEDLADVRKALDGLEALLSSRSSLIALLAAAAVSVPSSSSSASFMNNWKLGTKRREKCKNDEEETARGEAEHMEAGESLRISPALKEKSKEREMSRPRQRVILSGSHSRSSSTDASNKDFILHRLPYLQGHDEALTLALLQRQLQGEAVTEDEGETERLIEEGRMLMEIVGESVSILRRRLSLSGSLSLSMSMSSPPDRESEEDQETKFNSHSCSRLSAVPLAAASFSEGIAVVPSIPPHSNDAPSSAPAVPAPKEGAAGVCLSPLPCPPLSFPSGGHAAPCETATTETAGRGVEDRMDKLSRNKRGLSSLESRETEDRKGSGSKQKQRESSIAENTEETLNSVVNALRAELAEEQQGPHPSRDSKAGR